MNHSALAMNLTKLTKTFWTLSILLLLSISYSPTVFAQRYQVELIVFEHITHKALLTEAWPTDLTLPSMRNNIQLSIQGSAENFALLPAQAFKLTQAANALNHKSGYKVLMHLAWVMPITNKPQRIHLYGGELYSQNGVLEHSGFVDESEDRNQDQRWQINGTLQLSLKTYIHVHPDLILALPTQNLPREMVGDLHQPFMLFQLNQTRRMRSKELNYFDHPLFGILAIITPVAAALDG